MQWLHIILDQVKYCILDLAVLVLFCIGIVRIVRSEAERLRSARKNLGSGPNAAPKAKPIAGPQPGGSNRKTNGTRTGAPPKQHEPAHKA